MPDRFPWQPIDKSPAFLVLGSARGAGHLQPSLLQSLRYAVSGLREAFATQRNLRFLCALGMAACTFALLLQLPLHELALVVALTTLVVFAELVNTTLELMLDHLTGPDFDPSVKRIKDMAAASVLAVSLGAAILGNLIFLPYLTPAALHRALPHRWLSGCAALAFVSVLAVWACRPPRQQPLGSPAPRRAVVLCVCAALLAAVIAFSR